jgi:hypothetical protein
MHGLFVPEQSERQRNSRELVLDRFPRPKPHHLLQQKRSIMLHDPASYPARPSSLSKNKAI